MTQFIRRGAAAMMLAAAGTAIPGFAQQPPETPDRIDMFGNQEGQPDGQANPSDSTGASSVKPDVVLDVPQLSVDSLSLDVKSLNVNFALTARLGNVLQLDSGAKADAEAVTLAVEGLETEARFEASLENIRAVFERTLETLDKHPELVEQLSRGGSEGPQAGSDMTPSITGPGGQQIEQAGE